MQFIQTLLFLSMFTVLTFNTPLALADAPRSNKEAGLAHEHNSSIIHAMNAYTLAINTPSKTGAIFVSLHNSDGENDAKLVGVEVPTEIAQKAELHTHMMDGDIMKMRKVDAVIIEPNAHKLLEPGGNHIMLFGMEKELVAGASFPVTLVFEKSDPQIIEVKVLPIGQTPDKTHRH